MNHLVKTENVKKAKNVKFEVKKNQKDVRKRNARRMIQKTSQRKKELVIQTNIHPVKRAEKRKKGKRRNLNPHLHLQRHQLNQTCQLLKRSAALLI
jgi:hypothetical protein